MGSRELADDKLGNVMVRYTSERSECPHGVSNFTIAHAQLIYISTMTMEDYGLARLTKLTEQLGSSDTTRSSTIIEEIIRILSNLAASLRDGEFRSKLELTLRIRTRTATRVHFTHHTGQTTVIRSRERQLAAASAGWTCRSKLWCRKLSVLINSGSFS